MSKLDDAFKNKPIFMPYFPLGYPTLDVSVDVIEALAQNGADVIEVACHFLTRWQMAPSFNGPRRWRWITGSPSPRRWPL